MLGYQSVFSMSDEGDKKSFWTTLPGILTGIAAVIVAITGLMQYYPGPDGNEPGQKIIDGGPGAEPLSGPDGNESEKKTIDEEPVVEPPFVETEPVTPIDELEPEIWRHNDLDKTSEPGDKFGWSVAAGDFNNDGLDDLAIGAPNKTIIDVEKAGVVYVIYGSSGGLEINSMQIWYDTLATGGGTEKDDSFGWSLAAGDFDKDGCDDLAIGVPGETVGKKIQKAGAMFVLYGSESDGLQKERSRLWYMDNLIKKGSSEKNDGFGWSLTAGDFDNDGCDDIAIGMPGKAVGNEAEAGAMFVLYGIKTNGLQKNSAKKLWYQKLGIGGISEKSDRFGESVAAGDFNQDGIDDLAIKVPGENIGNGPGEGALNVLFGSIGGLTNEGPLLKYQNLSIGVWLEPRPPVASGDFNGDGKDDQAIGMPESNNGPGAVEVHYGV